jgi:hypothetical protein
MGYSQYWLNKIMDAEHRGQAITFPSPRYIGLFSTLPTRSTAGTEISVGAGYTGYARVSDTPSLANWSGTQGAGTTAVSSGSGASADRISNNVAVSFSASLAAAWAGIVGFGFFDAASAGNLLEWGVIVDSNGDPITRSFVAGDAVEFAAGTLILYRS